MNAQSLYPSVIATAGTIQSNANVSLSWTLGETVIPTFKTNDNILTQGFQQPYYASLQIKAFLQGYYSGAGNMKNVLYNQGITNSQGIECDSIIIQLRQAMYPYALIAEAKQIIQTDGLINYTCNGTSIGQSYYIVLKHRNSLETWSANPVLLNKHTFYDFSNSNSLAFGNNMIEVDPGIWAIYSGDFNQDENIDLLDLAEVETDINYFQYGYLATDINGDGNVDLLDTPALEENISNFVFSNHP